MAGVRAYNVRAGLRANHARLLDYVRNGGTYIVQYNTAEPGLNIGPYAITIPGGNHFRVTVEDAPVTLPHPDSRLLQAPNHINPKDFDGWIQERGLYFATEWDKRYETVPSCPTILATSPWKAANCGRATAKAYTFLRRFPGLGNCRGWSAGSLSVIREYVEREVVCYDWHWGGQQLSTANLPRIRLEIDFDLQLDPSRPR